MMLQANEKAGIKAGIVDLIGGTAITESKGWA